MRTNVLSWAKVASWLGAAGVALATAAAPSSAVAQSEPDVRAIRPALMLLLDSSGSMEYTAQGAEPACSGDPLVTTSGRSRWAMVVEALAGEYANYYCTTLQRNTAPFVGAPDYNYHIPYHQPGGASLGNGILSIYGDRVKFGMMTFDTLPATTGQFIDAWLTQASCQAADGGANADYSYGECRRLHFEGCTHAGFWVNHGARRELGDTFPAVPDGVLGGSDTLAELAFGSGFDGAMVSVGAPTDDPAQLDTTRNRIVSSLASRRPFGPTPLAAQIDDAYQYFSTHPDVRDPAVAGTGDGYYECRTRFMIILSDGRPNLDFRDDPLNCDQGATGVCPYPLPAARVAQLYADHGVRTAVIGFSSTGDPEFPQMRSELEAIAAAGQTDDCIARAVASGMPPLVAPNAPASTRVFWANNRAQLMSAMSAIIDACVNTVPTSRTRASFAPIASGSGGQFQVQSSFQVGPGEPWRGFLERRRFTCNVPVAGPPTVVDQPLDATLGDDFAARLDANNSRNIITALYSGASGCTSGVGCIAAAQGNAYRVSNAGTTLTQVALDNVSVTAEDLAILGGTPLSRATARTQVLDFVYGRGVAPLARRTHKLGDIYRSSPTVMTAPTLDIADQSFNDFRSQPLTFDAGLARWVGAAHPTVLDAGRPGAVYVGTNDGLLHGFELEADVASGVLAGQENWAFVPPYHLPRLRDQLTTHQWYVDGTPAVKDVRFSRTLANTNDFREWRTLLSVGMRAGGTSYTTMDVTHPRNPQFLWQFSAEVPASTSTSIRPERWRRRMGLTGSVAGITTLNVTLPALATNDMFGRARRPELGTTGERGVVLIAGGLPQQCEASEVGCTAAQYRANPSVCTCVHFQDTTGCPPAVAPATLGIGGVSPDGLGTTSTLVRDEMRCYGAPQGQYLWVVDAQTGYVLKEFGPCRIGRLGGGANDPTVSPAGECIDAPITGSIAPFPGITGTVSTRAYAGDAEGRVWRFDFSDPRPAFWRAGVLYDMYYDQNDAEIAQRIVEAPVVSVDPVGNPVIVVGSGDPDLLEGRDMNRVASITEIPTFSAGGAITAIRARENWRIQLEDGERVTGPLELFNNAVYFGTFNASTATDLCDFGEGSVWGVDYRVPLNVIGGHALPRQMLPVGAFTRCNLAESPSATGTVRCVTAGDNSVVFGVGITQRPTCLRTTTENIPGLGTRTRVQEVGGGNFDLVIQTGRGGAGAPAGGWITNTTTVPLAVPSAFSRVDSWYSLIE